MGVRDCTGAFHYSAPRGERCQLSRPSRPRLTADGVSVASHVGEDLQNTRFGQYALVE